MTASGWYGGQSGEECGLAPFNLYEVPWGEQSPTPSLVDTYSSEVAQSVLVSAGNYLYTDAQYNQTSSDELAQISKATGALAYIAGSGSSGLQDGTGLNAAAIAWTGHAGATLGEGGNLHLVADTMHLVAVSAWIGGLVPLVLLLAAAGRRPEVASAALAHAAAQRFSTLGIVSVATLSAAGLRIRITIRAGDEGPVPVAYGLHPYLTACRLGRQ